MCTLELSNNLTDFTLIIITVVRCTSIIIIVAVSLLFVIWTHGCEFCVLQMAKSRKRKVKYIYYSAVV